MKARIVKLGNSHGIRIPSPLLRQTGLSGEVDIFAEEDRLVIQPTTRPRSGWAEAFAQMAARGEDVLLDGGPGIGSSWDEAEWEW